MGNELHIMGGEGGQAYHSPHEGLRRRFPPGFPEGQTTRHETQKKAQGSRYGGQ